MKLDWFKEAAVDFAARIREESEISLAYNNVNLCFNIPLGAILWFYKKRATLPPWG